MGRGKPVKGGAGKPPREVGPLDARVASVLDACPDGLIILDHDGRVAHANAAAARILGIAAADLPGLAFHEHSWSFSTAAGEPFERGIPPFLLQLKNGGAVRDAECSIEHTDGTKVQISLNASCYPGTGSVPAATAIHLRRVSGSSALGTTRAADGPGSTLAALVAGIGNDFNNILTAIMGNTSLAKTDVDPKDELYRNLTYIEKASIRAQDLAQRLLQVSQPDTSERAHHHAGTLVIQAVEAGLTGSTAGFDLHIPDGLPPVEVDYEQIMEALIAVLRHIDRAGSGLHLTRIAVDRANPSERAASTAGREFVRIAVQAEPREGDGARPESSEIHSATLRGLIVEQRGHLEIVEDLAGGLTVDIFLPAAQGQGVAKETAPQGMIPGTGRVLVMDDEEMVREVVARMLIRLGYSAAFAANGQEALGLYAAALDEGRRFDAIVMDLTVPEGMGGREAIRELLKLDPGARVIVSTGYSTEPILTDFERHGFKGVVVKPYEIIRLSRALHDVLAPPGG